MPRKYRGKKSPLLCCCVPGCLENSNRSRQAKFHLVPEEDSALGRRKQAKWLKALGVNFKPTQKSRVCETHFKLYPRNSEKKYKKGQRALRTVTNVRLPSTNENVAGSDETFGKIEFSGGFAVSKSVQCIQSPAPIEAAQKILNEFDSVFEDASLKQLKVKCGDLINLQNGAWNADFDDFNYKDWLHNEIKLTTLGKQNESIMKSFLSLSQNLADIQRELQLFLDRSSRSRSIPVNQQIESARKFLNEVTQTRQKCIREIREYIRLSEDLVYREKQRWNFIHKLSDAQEVLQYLFDELVKTRLHNGQDSSRSLKELETEEPSFESGQSSRKRIRMSHRDGPPFVSFDSESDPLDLTDFPSLEGSGSRHKTMVIKPETELDDEQSSDATHHMLPDSVSDSYRPSALDMGKETHRHQPLQPIGSSTPSEKAPCVRLTLVGSQIVNLETNAVVADLNAVASAAGHPAATSDGKLNPQTLLSIMKLLPGVKKSLRVVSVPAASKPSLDRSLTNSQDTAVRNLTQVSESLHHSPADSDSSKCLVSSPSVAPQKSPRVVNDLQQKSPPLSSNQTQENMTQQQPQQQQQQPQQQNSQNERTSPTAPPAKPCVRLKLVDNKIVNLETNAVIADLNAMGASGGQLDSATLRNIMKLLPGAKKSLRVVSVPGGARVDPPSAAAAASASPTDGPSR